MANYDGGSVTASIKLNTEDFDTKIEALESKVKDLKAVMQDNGLMDVSKRVAELEGKLKAANSTIADYKNKLNASRDANRKFRAEIETNNSTLDKLSSNLKKTGDTAQTTGKQLKNAFTQNKASSFNYLNKDLANAGKAMQVFNAQARGMGKAFNPSNLALKNAGVALNTFERGLKTAEVIFGRVTDVLRTFNFQLIENDKTITKNGVKYGQFTERVIALASAMHRMNAQGTANWEGRGQFGYSQYIANIEKATAATRLFTKEYDLSKIKLETTAYDKVNAELNKLAASYKRVQMAMAEINTRSSTLNSRIKVLQGSIATLSNSGRLEQMVLTNLGRSATNLGFKLKNLNNDYQKGKITTTQYRTNVQKLEAELTKLQSKFTSTKAGLEKNNASYTKANAELQKLAAQYRSTGQASGQMGASVKSASNSMNSATNSVKLLSNNLYKIRGVLLSLKMIFTAMGGMALWGFATNIAEGVKETFRAKNEMEAQLRQNSKVGSGGIQYFNEQLDAMTDKFKKINKYSIGETVSAIGLEFNLNAKEMADSLDVISMIQSEYVRAGRKEEEAALAVKDILQGEFQRLSRETGVGKEELEAYGWNGDKRDVESLMKALRAAALDRHWDIFAAKATSLNDVMTIMKSRFSETGADLMQSATPLIVGAFNAILDVIDKVQSGFNGLNSFWQNFTIFGGLTAGFAALTTALPMVAKGFGLVDIATLGWGKSLLTTAFNLDKTEVATYGFRKALMGVISGTDAAKVSEIGLVKSMAARILGVKQSTLAEKGLLTAMVQSKAVMSGTNETLAKLAGNSMGTAQKIAYLATNMDLNKAKTLSTRQAILKTATSFKVLRTVILGVVAISLISWLAGVAAWCDKVKKSVDGFNYVAENGKSLLKDAKKSVDDYKKSLSKLKEGTDEYARAAANLSQAEANVHDIEEANKRAKAYKKVNDEREKEIKLRHQQALADSYRLAGKDNKAATEAASGYTAQVEAGQYYLNRALDIYDDRLYKASQHMNEHVTQLEEAGVKGEALEKYISEYNLEAENAAQLWKKFNEGDMASGAYAVLSELKLIWIDFTNHPQVVTLFKTLRDTFESWKPTLKAVSNFLKDVALGLVDLANGFLSTDIGKQTALFAGFGIAIAAVGKKLYNVVGGTKSTLDVFKSLFSALKDGINKWRKYGEAAEEANKKAETPTSTGGIVKEKNMGLKEGIKADFKNNARNFLKYATQIAMAMALVTEAIILLNAPMGALAATGYVFQNLEPQIRKGIDGLKLVAPTIAAIMVPVLALVVIMDKFNIQMASMTEGFINAAMGIAMGITLVTEAILLLNMPLIGLGALGWMYGQIQDHVDNGIKAMDAVNQGLMSLVPWIPVFAAGIALMAATIGSGGVAGVAIPIAAAGIALGIAMVTEAIFCLYMPLTAIASLGNAYPDLDGVRRGAEAIKLTAEALTSLEEAFAALVAVHWLAIGDAIAQLVGVQMNIDLTSLTGEGGIFDQLNKFSTEFATVNIVPIDQAKVDALNTAANGISTVATALRNVKTAMDNLPPEFKNQGAGVQTGKPLLNYNMDTANLQLDVAVSDGTGFFDQFMEPIRQLNDFVTKFNALPITAPDAEKLAAINQSANFISSIKTAIENVKSALQMAGQAQLAASATGGGMIGMAVTAIAGTLGSSSSIGSGLDELYNCIKDIMGFNSKIGELTANTGGDTSGITGAANMVSALQGQINELKSTLSGAVPAIKSAAQGIGTGIVEGVKNGLMTMNPTITGALDGAREAITGKIDGITTDMNSKFKSGIEPMSDTMSGELSRVGESIDGKWDELGEKAYQLAKHISDRFQDGMDMHSPGIIARSFFAEMGRLGTALDTAITTLPQKTYSLAQSMVGQFNPQFDMVLPNATELNTFKMGLQGITTTANQTNTATTTAFNNMNLAANQNMGSMATTVQGAFTNIKNTSNSSYNTIVSKTRTSLASMQSQTTKNIGAIRTSWKGMQNALIQSAENIRSQTGRKIHDLQSNMATFWRKVQNPALLLGGAGDESVAKHTNRRVYGISGRGGRKITPKRHYAGHKMGKTRTATKQTGISSKFKIPSIKKDFILDYMQQYIDCIKNGGDCVAGGWNFNWSPDIQRAFMQWRTHFGEIYDKHLTVGKFEHDNFPVRGIAEIAKKYIYDAISRTNYSFYFDHKYGSALEAWNAGSFNCMDGAMVINALAAAFGFPGGGYGHGSWSGTGHVWAVVPGLGVMDATAIQRGYGFKSPKVSGYGSSTLVRNGKKNNRSPNDGGGDSYGDVNITINNNGKDITVNEQSVDKKVGKKIYDLIRPSLSTGR